MKIATAVALSLLLGLGGFYLGRATLPEPAEPRARAPAEAPPSPSPPAALSGPLGRDDLIAVGAAAADAFASGRASPKSVEQLAGRRFQIRIPFGCGGSSTDEAALLRMDYDAERETLRLSVAPDKLSRSDWMTMLADAEPSEVALFWLSRPWTSSEQCPRSAAPDPRAAAGKTLGLAQIYLPTDSRVGRLNDKPFTTNRQLPVDRWEQGKGLQLRLEGRVMNWPAGPSIACVGDDPQERPVCLIGVELERLAVENPADRSVLADWRL